MQYMILQLFVRQGRMIFAPWREKTVRKGALRPCEDLGETGNHICDAKIACDQQRSQAKNAELPL